MREVAAALTGQDHATMAKVLQLIVESRPKLAEGLHLLG
jgi:hypothetical protein